LPKIEFSFPKSKITNFILSTKPNRIKMSESVMTRAVVVLITLVVLALMYSTIITMCVVQYVYATIYSDASCVTAAVIDLSAWLYVNASVWLASATVCTIGIIGTVASGEWLPGMIIGNVITIIAGLLTFLFVLAWTIVGAVELFAHDSSCEGRSHPLWAVVLTTLILEWIYLAGACCGGGGYSSYKGKTASLE
jgi:hypothetical protein